MYEHLVELPTQVRGALTEEEQTVWMNSYNASWKVGQEGWDYAWDVVSGLSSVRTMEGTASKAVVDGEDELVDQEPMLREMNDVIFNYGLAIHDFHSNRPCGVWYKAFKGTDEKGVECTRIRGVAYKGKEHYDKFWELVQGRIYKGLSVGFKRLDVERECNAKSCHSRIKDLQVFEVSAVPKGMCPGSDLDTVNYAAKGVGGMENEKGTEQTQSPGAAPDASQMANKEAIMASLGDPGVAALQKLLVLTADTNKKVDALSAQLNVRLSEETNEEVPPGQNVPNGSTGNEAPAKSGEEKPKEEKKEEGKKMAEKAIDPPMAATTTATPEETALAEKEKAICDVKKVQEQAKMAAKSGVQTPRPESAEKDHGVSREDALQKFLHDPELRKKSALDLEKFANQYMKGEI